MKRSNVAVMVAVLATSWTACDKTNSPAATTTAAPAAPKPAAVAPPPPAAAAPPPAAAAPSAPAANAKPTEAPAAAAAGGDKKRVAKTKGERIATATFVKSEDGAKDKFAGVVCNVTNNGPADLKTEHAVAYYYDKAGKLLKKGDAFTANESVAKGKSAEIKLAWVSDTPPNTAKIEVEIYDVVFADDSTWENNALDDDKRPQGGLK